MAARKEREPAPPEQLAALARQLAEGPLPRAVLLRGEERYFRNQALDLLAAAARARQLELARHDAHDPDFVLGRLCDDLTVAPMFATARMIVVRGAAGLLKKEGGEEPPFARAALTFVQGAAPEGTLVIEAEGLRADAALAKAIVARGGPSLNLRALWDTPPPWNPDPRQVELVQWLGQRARERGLALKLEELLYVASATGNELAALDDALGRLAHRGTQSVREAVGWTGSASPFETAEHLCRGDAPSAVAGLEALFQQGFADKDGTRTLDANALLTVLFGSLRGKLRPTLAAARALAAGGDLARVAEELELRGSPRSRGEFEARVPLRSPRQWAAMLADLAELERRNRSGAAVDVNELVLYALRWARQPAVPAGAPARARGR